MLLWLRIVTSTNSLFFSFSTYVFRVGLNYNIALKISKKYAKNYSGFSLAHIIRSQKLRPKMRMVLSVQKY
jgi:3-methyladenine DNA glycosylase Tag